jgi:cell division protein FtsW (lipid II flippase)
LARSLVNFGASSGFLLLHLSVIRHHFLRQRNSNWVRHLVMPLLGLVIIGYVLYEMDPAAKKLGAAWLALGVVYYLLVAAGGHGGVPRGSVQWSARGD